MSFFIRPDGCLRGVSRVVAVATLTLQTLLPLALTLTPVMTSRADTPVHSLSSTAPVYTAGMDTVPYTLKAGETPAQVAATFGMTLPQLQTLNEFRVFHVPFAQLRAGDEIDVPAHPGQPVPDELKTVKDSRTQQQQADGEVGQALSGVQSAAGMLRNSHPQEVATGMARSMATGEATTAATVAGDHTVTAGVNGGTKDVTTTFMAGAVDTTKSTLTASVGTLVADGKTTVQVTLTLKDMNNNPVTGLTGVAFTKADAGTAGVAAAATFGDVQESSPGVYTATLSGTMAGVVTIGTTVDGSTFSVTLTPDTATATVTALTNTTSAETKLANDSDAHVLQATVKAARDNPVSGTAVTWTVTAQTASSGTTGAGTPVLSGTTTQTDESGIATLTVTDNAAETVTVQAKVSANTGDSGTVADATFSLYPVVSGIAQGVNDSPADYDAGMDIGTANTLIVSVQDLAGNALNNQAVTLDFMGTNLGTGPAVLKAGSPEAVTSTGSPYTATTDDSGHITLSAYDVTAETISVSAKVSTQTEMTQTAGSTFAVHPVLTSLTADVNNQPADNEAFNTVVAHIADMAGNALTNASVTLYFTADKGTASFTDTPPLTATTDDSGNVTLSLKDSQHEDVIVQVGLRDGDEYKSTTLTFAAPPAITGVTTVQNEYTFPTGSGFPTTGFAQAQFKVNLSSGNLTDYDWVMADGNTDSTVADGVVTLNAAHSGVQTVQAKSKSSGATVLTYEFTVSKWYTPSGGRGPTEDAVCTSANQGVFAYVEDVIGDVGAGYHGPARGNLGSLRTEWGDSQTYNVGSWRLSEGNLYAAGKKLNPTYLYGLDLSDGSLTFAIGPVGASTFHYFVCVVREPG